MWYPSRIVEPPSAEPISVEEVKRHCVIESTDDDDLLPDLIKAARSHVEAYCNARFAEQTIECECDSFADFARLPEGPLKSVTSIRYVDPAGAEQTLSEGVYVERKDGLEPSIGLKSGQSWPTIRPGSRITLTAVYGGELPASVRVAMLMFIDDVYHQRGNSSREEWTAFDSMLCNHRRGA